MSDEHDQGEGPDAPKSAEAKSLAKPGEEPENGSETLDEPMNEELDDVDLRDLLRGVLRPPPRSVAPRLLPGVERRLRLRSRGKFYGDGWSTAQSPRSTYLVTSIVMLLVIAFVFVVLIPWSSGTLP